MKINRLKRSAAIAVLAALSLPAATAFATGPSEALAKSTFQAKSIAWAPQFAYRSASLRVSGPGGLVVDREFGAGKPVFDLSSVPFVADGQYSFELVFGRQPGEALEKAMSRAQVGEDGSIADAGLAAKLAALRETVSGTFTVSEGIIASPYLFEPSGGKAESMLKDIIHADDVIAQLSLCVGFDCVNGESFGFDTIRMKENNVRLHFNDTSTGSFPTNDWRIVANDTTSGGASYLAIEDADTARRVFEVRAGAPSNSVFVDSGGRVGFRTSTPVLDLHARTGNTPAIRLEQDGSSGFTAQTWDIGANEANFFVRDVTGGSRLPFRIRPGAPQSSIDIAASGNVGFGTQSPGAKLHAVYPFGKTDTTARSAAWLASNDASNQSILNVYAVGAASQAGRRWGLQTQEIGVTNTGSLVFQEFGGNVGIGTASPVAKLHVEGNARINGSLQVTGACCGPDYVFSPGFKLASIEENAAYMWSNRHLPAVGPAKTTENGLGVVNVYSQANGMLEELEKAHIYIEQLHKEIKNLKAEATERDAAMRAELAELRELIRK